MYMYIPINLFLTIVFIITVIAISFSTALLATDISFYIRQKLKEKRMYDTLNLISLYPTYTKKWSLIKI